MKKQLGRLAVSSLFLSMLTACQVDTAGIMPSTTKSAGTPLSFRLTLTPGSSHRYRYTAEKKDYNIEDKLLFSETLVQDHTYRIQTLNANGSGQIDFVFNDVKATRENGLTGDVATALNQQAQAEDLIYAPLKGLGYPFRLAADGVIEQVSNSDELQKQVTQKLAAAPEATKQLALAYLPEIFKAESLRKNLQEFFIRFPSESIRVGHSWSQQENYSFESESGTVRLSLDRVWKLKEQNAGISTFELQGTMRSGSTDPDDSLKMNGSFQVDEKTGWLKKSEMKLTQTLDAETRRRLAEATGSLNVSLPVRSESSFLTEEVPL